MFDHVILWQLVVIGAVMRHGSYHTTYISMQLTDIYTIR